MGELFSLRGKSVFVSGHNGLVGSAVVRALRGKDNSILTASRAEMDLRDQQQVNEWFQRHRPQVVIHVAGTVGGIHANNSRPVDFLYDNTLIHLTVLKAAWKYSVEKLLYLGSSCIYPRDCPQPIKEEFLLTGPLEPTNDSYAIAKISGVLSCRAYRKQYGCDFISAMPTNLYGPNDNFDLQSSHVLSALIRKFHDAKLRSAREVTVWGTGQPRREFLHVDDLAEACLVLLEKYDGATPINVGSGEDVTIADLADRIRRVVYPEARVIFDTTMPDGTPRKLLDVSRIHALGWRHRISLDDGIRRTCEWFLERYDRESERELHGLSAAKW
jgi:GDP-L-fucose synthase